MQNQPNNRFSQIFEIALVVLGVLSAAEYDFFKELYGLQHAFKLVTTPIGLIIGIWLTKEIGRDHLSLEKWLCLTEFSWLLWLLTFSYYQYFAWIIQVPITLGALIGLVIISVLMLGLYYLISKAFEFNYCNLIPNYYQNREWRVKRLLLTISGIVIIAFIFLSTTNL